jgi:sulfite exporter TauE/SafE
VSEFGLLLAFTTGLAGAPHCLGMCSGLAGGLFLHQGLARGGLPAALYHGARVLTYVVLGTGGALLGQVIVQVGGFGKAQGLLMIAAGLAIVALGLGLLGVLRAAAPARCGRAVPAPGEEVRPPRLARVVLAGLGNGLVPCSLVFSVAIKAAATASPAQAAALMLAFGLGTVPTMLGVSLLAGALGNRACGRGRILAGIAVLALGLWTLYEGIVFYDVMRGLAG